MPPALLQQLAALLRAIETTQARHLECLARKRAALRAANAAELLQIAPEEETIVRQMQELLSIRQRLVKTAGGAVGGSLLDLVTTDGSREAATLAAQIGRIRAASARIQRENRIQWFLAQSRNLATQAMVEMLRNKGKAPALYGQRRAGGGVGLLIDKTV